MKKPVVLFLLAAAVGVALLLWGNLSRDGEDGGADTPAAETDLLAVEAFRADLESRMAALCARVRGAGQVTVSVGLSGGYRYVYACDQKPTSMGLATTHLTVGSGAGETPVCVTVEAPAIIGIGVVCSGGADPGVQAEITALLSATYGVSVNKIYVTAGG